MISILEELIVAVRVNLGQDQEVPRKIGLPDPEVEAEVRQDQVEAQNTASPKAGLDHLAVVARALQDRAVTVDLLRPVHRIVQVVRPEDRARYRYRDVMVRPVFCRGEG